MKMKILIVLLILFLLGTITGFWQVQRLKEENISLKERNEELEARKKIVETKLREKEDEIARLLSQIEEKIQQIASIEDQIKNDKAIKEEIILQLKNKEEELTKEKERVLELEDKLNKADIEFKNLLARAKDLESKKEDLEKKLKDLEAKPETVELGKIEVKGEEDIIEVKGEEDIQVMSPPKRLEGKILVVNKDYNFAVINLGESDGLNLSDILSVYHQNEHLGNVKVEELRDKMSVVTFLDEGMKDTVKEEDFVIFPSQ